MKLTTLIMLLACVMASARSMSQGISLSVKNGNIEKIFTDIQKQTGYEFLYSAKIIKDAKPVSISVKNAGINEVLGQCFKNQPFSFTIIDKTVVVKPAKTLNETNLNGQPGAKKAPPVVITGKVVDVDGKAMSGVSILIKGTEFGTSSNQSGDFSLSIPENSSHTLVFSHLGYERQEYQAKKSETISIVLKKTTTKMDEVVVVGYGTQKKKDVLGAVSTLTDKDIKNLPATTSMMEILNGRLPGLNVTNRSGQPGKSDYSLITRGNSNGLNPGQLTTNSNNVNPTNPFNNTQLNNFNFGNSMPLVLIDGIEGDINLLNPQDVASITLLKDAAAAIYGVRAGNGVLLVTTKKGVKGRVAIDYQYNLGRQSIATLPKFLPSWQQAVLINEAMDNEPSTGGGGIGGGGVIIGGSFGGGRPARSLHRFTDEEIQKYKDGTDPNYPNTDWMGLVYQKPGIRQQHNLNIGGGDEKTTYRMSFEYLNQAGNIDGVNNKRYGARMALVSNPFKTVKIETGLNFVNEPSQERGGASGFIGDILGHAYTISPMIPLKYQNGAYSTTFSPNPIADLNSGSFYKASTTTTNGNLVLTWTPIEDLVIKPSIGFNYSITSSQIFTSRLNAYLDGPAGTTPQVDQLSSRLNNSFTDIMNTGLGITPQITASYQKVIDNHLFALLTGASQSTGNGRSLSAKRQNLLNNSLQSLNLASIDGQLVNGYVSQTVQQSVFGRLFYNYGDRYYLEGTLRGDGTTSFSPDRRWGVFPSFSGGWVVSNESFFMHSALLKSLNFLKIRGSWSRVGNSSIGNFAYLTRLVTGNTVFNNQVQTYLQPGTVGNPNINWETTTIQNIGLDASLFNNRLSLTLEAYNKVTDDILLTLAAPANFGYPGAPVENVGAMRNKGIEAEIGYDGRAGEFKWWAKGTLGYNKNKITNYVYKNLIPKFDELSQNLQGYSYNGLFGLEAEGIYQTQNEVDQSAKMDGVNIKPGDIKYKDQNGDGKITPEDRIFLGNSVPTTTFGLSLGTSWKGFSLSMFFHGSAGRKVSVGSALGSIGDFENKVTPAFWDRWTPENPTNKFPRAWANNIQNNPTQVQSSFWIRDASYIRLSNVSLSYDFAGKLFNNTPIKGIRVFYSGSNLFTYAPKFWKWLDPETSQVEASVFSYPSASTHAFGFSVQF